MSGLACAVDGVRGLAERGGARAEGADTEDGDGASGVHSAGSSGDAGAPAPAALPLP